MLWYGIYSHITYYILRDVGNGVQLQTEGRSQVSMLNVSHVTKKFGEQTVVNDLSFAVEKGQFFGDTRPQRRRKVSPIKDLRSFEDENWSGIPFNNPPTLHFKNISSLKQGMPRRNNNA